MDSFGNFFSLRNIDFLFGSRLQALAGSVTLGVGQFCTNPGLLSVHFIFQRHSMETGYVLHEKILGFLTYFLTHYPVN